MRILLTGGTGFIGSHFLHQALVTGHSVLALRRSSASKPRIQIDREPDWLDRQLNEVTASEMDGCDVLVHLAAHSVQYPFDSLANCLHWNLMAVLALFEQARKAGIQRFIVAGSCFEYGKSGERYTEIPTDAPLEPTNSYAASKAAASIALLQWAEEHDLSLEILRVFHVFGEGEPETRFWPSLRRAALAGEDFPMTAGEQIREFLAVKDVSQTFLDRSNLAPTSAQVVQIFNLRSDKPISFRSFAEHWWKQWNAKDKLIFGEIPYRKHEVMRYAAGPNSLRIGIKSHPSTRSSQTQQLESMNP
jgi:nucleoside-diphosphate-sugar epimerase